MRGESTIMWKLIKHDFIAGGKKNIIKFIDFVKKNDIHYIINTKELS